MHKFKTPAPSGPKKRSQIPKENKCLENKILRRKTAKEEETEERLRKLET
jgi:hypothetical protein